MKPVLLVGVGTVVAIMGCSSESRTAPVETSTISPPVSSTAAASPLAPPTLLPTAAQTSVLNASGFPDASSYSWIPIVGGFTYPVDIQFATDASGRMFIVEQGGRIQVVGVSGLNAEPFLDISDRVEKVGYEQGLLGLAFHPRFPENGVFFVSYTDRSQHNVISRFRLAEDDRRADPSSETVLLAIDDPFPNHNGGVLAFGPDGYLYAGIGDGGGANDPFGNGQNTDSLLGTILRIDVDRAEPYAIPEDNPFAQGGGSPEVWAYGLRNPWRMSFDRSTGNLYIADVGQNAWEEVDLVFSGTPGGVNFGWNYREGAHAFRGTPPPGAILTDPIAEYDHSGGNSTIIGGYVYRGRMPEWNGIYLYADFGTGRVWGLLPPRDPTDSSPAAAQLLFETGVPITSFGQDPGGEVYFAERGGSIYRLDSLP